MSRLAKASTQGFLPLCLVALLSTTLPCFADGKVFSPVAFPANVTIPDQRALIHFTNGLLGGTIREEDSPGNFTLREQGNGLEFVVYDAQGAEHVFDSWPIRPPR